VGPVVALLEGDALASRRVLVIHAEPDLGRVDPIERATREHLAALERVDRGVPRDDEQADLALGEVADLQVLGLELDHFV
jgi:hypothetical protein